MNAIFRPPAQRRRYPTEDRFVRRIRAVASEYLNAGLRPAGAMAEVLAALREMDRNAVRKERRQ